MNKNNVIALIALLILVVALPVYALLEPNRMDQARAGLRQQFVADGAITYVENCAFCHGAAGAGIGAMPALDNPGLAEADRDLLYRVIAHSSHGTSMAAWHLDEGGVLSDYQVEGLVTLIQHTDWSQVSELATARGFVTPTLAVPEVEMATMEGGKGSDPHECSACHEEPTVHAGRFGLNCSRCHTLQAWKPALLTRHTFLLDHGGEGLIACQTCHTQTYSEYTCYECHEHDPEQMGEKHAKEGIFEFENCVQCHPTGREGEGERFGGSYAGQGSEGWQISEDDTGQERKGDVLGITTPAMKAQEDGLVMGIK